MKESPNFSPWPAPASGKPVSMDVVVGDAEASTALQPSNAVPARRPIAALFSTAKRLSSRTERAERAAAKEEQRIGDELDDLPAGWCVAHSLDLDSDGAGRHVDHVAIGPGGVFMIYVEHQPGAKVWISEHAVTINGRDSDHLRLARFEARRASGRLTDACECDVTAQSVLVLIGAATMQTLSQPAEVHVRTQHDIRDWLCRQPVRLDPDTVRAVYDHLRPRVKLES